MKALLLVAHGSQRKESTDEVVELAGKLRNNRSHNFAIVNAAFLEAAQVMIPERIQQCVDEGASAIVVLPYFLNSGKHVVEDIPAIVASCKGRYPDIAISIAPYIGASPLMLDIILASADRAENP